MVIGGVTSVVKAETSLMNGVENKVIGSVVGFVAFVGVLVAVKSPRRVINGGSPEDGIRIKW
jgi:hypothetical protein